MDKIILNQLEFDIEDGKLEWIIKKLDILLSFQVGGLLVLIIVHLV